ncbi:hypothetical protein GQ53DRAFT_812685 [Thozetella sp. PMI_491]|nr:hypothetical protein GQ53DRAFT_812685 [Thozetella sp. PMI_491]
MDVDAQMALPNVQQPPSLANSLANSGRAWPAQYQSVPQTPAMQRRHETEASAKPMPERRASRERRLKLHRERGLVCCSREIPQHDPMRPPLRPADVGPGTMDGPCSRGINAAPIYGLVPSPSSAESEGVEQGQTAQRAPVGFLTGALCGSGFLASAQPRKSPRM